MSTNDGHVIARALTKPTFIWYLNRYISNAVAWKDIADKCIGQDDAYCLTLIKSKCWTDKSVDGGSWSERLERLIHERASLMAAYVDLERKKKVGNWDAVILKIDPVKVSPFVVKILEMIDAYTINLLKLYNIPYKFMTAKELPNLDEECLYFNYNRITWHCGLIKFKRICKMDICSDTPITPMCDYMTDADCINAGIMIWEFLLNDEYTFPNCVPLVAEEEHLRKHFIFIDHNQMG